MEELIGRKFKRNKYGLSTWTDTVRSVSVQWSMKLDLVKKPHKTLKLKTIKRIGDIATVVVKGTKFTYPLNEIIFVE